MNKFLELFDQANLATNGDNEDISFVKRLRQNNVELFTQKRKDLEKQLDSCSSVRKREKKQFERSVK